MSPTAAARRERNQSDYAYTQVRAMITSGEIAPGDRLKEAELAERLSISRTPVREALKRLIAEHLVSRDDRGGVAVHVPTPREVDDTYRIREVLEGLSARLAAQRISDAELTRLAATVDAIETAAAEGRLDDVVAANVAFHDLLNEATGNERLVKLGQELRDSILLFSREAFASLGSAQQTAQEHADILAALRDHDADQAELAARTHVARARHSTTEKALFQGSALTA
jgi:DNA-binding GntR family transcriptional regulator